MLYCYFSLQAIIQYPTHIGDPDEWHDYTYFTAWRSQLTRLWAQRCRESLHVCHPSGPTNQPPGSLKQKHSSSWQPSRASELSSTTWCYNQLAAIRRGGRHHDITIGVQALRLVKSRDDATVVHLTRTARKVAPVKWGNGRPETIAVHPAPQGSDNRSPKWFSSHHPGQSSTTARTSHTCRPDWGQSQFSLPLRVQNLWDHYPAYHSKHLPCDARQHSRATGACRGALAPGCLSAGITNPQPLEIRRPPPLVPQRPPLQHPRYLSDIPRHLLVPLAFRGRSPKMHPTVLPPAHIMDLDF